MNANPLDVEAVEGDRQVDVKLILVTSLYDLTKHGSTQHRTIDWMFANSGFVMNLDAHLVVFTEPEWATEILKRRAGRSTEIITIPLDNLVDPVRITGIQRGRIQDNATRTKVTSAYIQLMWAKYAMLDWVTSREIARTLTHHQNATHVGWIDFAITHVGKTVDGLEREIFADPSYLPRVHVLRPFDKIDTDLPHYWHNVHGHLAGGLVVGSARRMHKLCQWFWNAADEAVNLGLAPLDEGVLSFVVAQRPDDFAYSYGDYCDILINHDRTRGGAGHLHWQLQDAARCSETRHLTTIRELLQQLEGPSMTPETVEPETVETIMIAAPDSRLLTGLVMIVKDEAHGIAATLGSIKPYIDYWTILDTGSTDGTQDLIKQIMHGTPGELYQEPFVDFSATRNRALELHGEKTVFSFMPDADDILVNGNALRAILTAFRDQRGSNHNAYNVDIRRDNLTYHLPLVLRTVAKWRYRYRVHEIVGPTEGEGYASIQIPLVQTTQSRPALSAEATQRRWERDLKLLREDYIRDPRDPRVLFYLAQTYECLSRPVEALKVYRERIAVGGWYEETYEAKLRVAKILDALDRRARDPKTVRDAEEVRIAPTWAEVQAAYFDLYAERPEHAEPLFHLARHWYDTAPQMHPLAFVFAQRVARTPIPKSGLFIDAAVYEWRAAEIAAISGFYCDALGDAGVRAAGRQCAEQCVRAQPGNERFRANWAFYADSATALFPGYVEKRIDITPDDPFVANNPSIFYDGGLWWCVVRTTNYRIIDGQYLTLDADGKQVPIHDNPIVTRNWLLALTPDLDVREKWELVDKTGIPKSSYPVHGYEDSRLFAWQGRLHCTATVCDFDLDRADVGPCEIVLYTFDDVGRILEAKPLRGPWSQNAQKNWMPIVDSCDGDGVDVPLRIMYAATPHSTKANLITVREPAINEPGMLNVQIDREFFGSGRLRGGSQVIRISDEAFLCIVHDVAWTASNARIYLHRFVMFDNGFNVISMTNPFHFHKLGIEFCAGLAFDGCDRLVASFGVEDREPWFGIFSLATVRAKLRTDYVI